MVAPLITIWAFKTVGNLWTFGFFFFWDTVQRSTETKRPGQGVLNKLQYFLQKSINTLHFLFPLLIVIFQIVFSRLNQYQESMIPGAFPFWRCRADFQHRCHKMTPLLPCWKLMALTRWPPIFASGPTGTDACIGLESRLITAVWMNDTRWTKQIITTQWSMLSYSSVTVAYTETQDPLTDDTKFSWLPFPKPPSQRF